MIASTPAEAQGDVAQVQHHVPPMVRPSSVTYSSRRPAFLACSPRYLRPCTGRGVSASHYRATAPRSIGAPDHLADGGPHLAPRSARTVIEAGDDRAVAGVRLPLRTIPVRRVTTANGAERSFHPPAAIALPQLPSLRRNASATANVSASSTRVRLPGDRTTISQIVRGCRVGCGCSIRPHLEVRRPTSRSCAARDGRTGTVAAPRAAMYAAPDETPST